MTKSDTNKQEILKRWELMKGEDITRVLSWYFKKRSEEKRKLKGKRMSRNKKEIEKIFGT